jgi:hypothetical protein
VLLVASLLSVVVSVIAGWVAIGRLAAATARSLERVDASLEVAEQLAASTATSVDELQGTVDVVGDGLGSTADAMATTRQVSSNVRSLIDSLSFFNSVDDLVSSLESAESSLQTLESDLRTASESVSGADVQFTDTLERLRAIPADIAASRAEVKANLGTVGDQVWLWRLAMVAAALPIVLLLVQVYRTSAMMVAQP